MKNSDLKSKLVRATLISALAVSVSATLTGCESKQVKELKELLDAGDYTEAVNYYWNNIDKLEDKKLDEVVNASVDNVYNSYLSDVTDVDTARNQLKNLKEIGSNESDSYIDAKLALIDSNEAYEEGLEYMDNENYLDAIESFKLVTQDDPNYASAQSKITESEDLYVKSLITKAETYISDNDYTGAINYLTGFLSKLENNQALQDECGPRMWIHRSHNQREEDPEEI